MLLVNNPFLHVAVFLCLAHNKTSNYWSRAVETRKDLSDKCHLARHLPYVKPLHNLQAIRHWFPLARGRAPENSGPEYPKESEVFNPIHPAIPIRGHRAPLPSFQVPNVSLRNLQGSEFNLLLYQRSNVRSCFSA